MADKNLGSGFVSELESGFLASGFTTADTSTNYTETLLSDQGAMSDTYRRKSQSGKIEIVKRIKSKYKDDETYKQLFIQEFNVLDGMQNEYVVSIHNHGKDSQGLFYVMEYVDGKTLAQIIKDNDIKDLSGKLNILRQLLDGLQYVHNKGVVHRDLKPDNIMVGNRTKNVKIIDFGLAISDSFPDNLATAGTPKYMSPEQKKDAKKADHLSDIYAFGIIMKEFLGEKSSEILQYKKIIEKCTKDRKSERYQNCSSILADLKEKNKDIPDEIKKLISEIVEDGIVTPTERAQLNAKIIAYDLDEEVVNRELDYQLEKVLERMKKRKIKICLTSAALLIVAAVVWYVFGNITDDERPTDPVKGSEFDSTTNNPPKLPVDQRLQELIQNAETVFKNKNVARAKRMFEAALREYPDNKEIKDSISQCVEIIRRSDCQSLIQERENGKLGFADKDGYIVVDFLYDSELDRKAGMIVLKNGDKYCIIGGKDKNESRTQYIDYKWVREEGSFMMSKNLDGDKDFVKVENGNLIIEEL